LLYFAHANPFVIQKHILLKEDPSVTSNGNDTSNVIFIDFNNNMSLLFNEHKIIEFIDNITSNHSMLSPLATSLMQLLDILLMIPNAYIVIHIERGQSQYHLNICKSYKARRGEYVLLSEEQTQLWRNYFDIVREVFSDLLYRLPNVSVFSLDYMECDFIPYYLLQNRHSRAKGKWNSLLAELEDINVFISSSDKDMFQTAWFEEVKMFYRLVTSIKDERKKYMSPSDILYVLTNGKELYSREYSAKIQAAIVPFLLSVSGDSSDNVTGIKGLGIIRALEYFKDFLDKWGAEPDIFNYTTIGELRELYTRKLLPSLKNVLHAKKIEQNLELILMNHRLVDFKIISNDLPLDQLQKLDFLYEAHRKKVVFTPSEFEMFLKQLVTIEPVAINKLLTKYTQVYEKYTANKHNN